jgi:hypothetical protein
MVSKALECADEEEDESGGENEDEDTFTDEEEDFDEDEGYEDDYDDKLDSDVDATKLLVAKAELEAEEAELAACEIMAATII